MPAKRVDARWNSYPRVRRGVPIKLSEFTDEAGQPHDRYVVVGTSGSGKTTVSANLAAEFGLEHIELDALHWLEDWTERPPKEFRDLVERETREGPWVVDGNYSAARDIVWPRADAIVWLDPPFHVVMARVIKRTLGRVLTGRTLWSGNQTSFRRAFLSSDSIILWAAQTWKRRRKSYSKLLYTSECDHLDIFRVRSVSMGDVDVRRAGH